MVISSRHKGIAMTYKEVQAFLGEICHVRVRCIACRDSHVLVGLVQQGKLCGEVAVRGYTFSVEDIEQIWRSTPSIPRRRRRWLALLFQTQPLRGSSGA
jgi:hypothetical protein